MFKATHNEAEYEALIAEIELCYTAGIDSIKVYSNSQLVVSQLNGKHEIKDDKMAAYVCRVREATSRLKNFSIAQIPPV